MLNTTKWVLVADDDESFSNSLCEILTKSFGKEIKLVQARDGFEAIAKINNQAFHLIIIDMKMPRKDGGEVIEAVRANDFNETVPIMLVSGFASLEVEKKYKFVNFVPKPIDAEKFVKMVRNSFSIGSTEKMISASIFNSLLDSSLKFLGEALKRQDFKLGEFNYKKVGVEVKAEHAAIITTRIGKVENTFSVLCSEGTLMQIRDGSEKISGSSLDVICKSLGYVILKHVLTECGIIDSNQVQTKDITQDPQSLTEKKGIIVPIEANGIDYKVFATTKGLLNL